MLNGIGIQNPGIEAWVDEVGPRLREVPVPVWGFCKPGAKVTVEFSAQKKTAIAGKDGKWILELDELKASFEPREMVVSDGTGEQVVVENVLVAPGRVAYAVRCAGVRVRVRQAAAWRHGTLEGTDETTGLARVRVDNVLDPPAGGARALRRRIAVERKKRTRRRRVVAGTTTGAVVALAMFLAFGKPLTTREPPAAELDFAFARMGLGTIAAPDPAVAIVGDSRRDTAALELPSSDERVVLYLVASSPPPESTAPAEAPSPTSDNDERAPDET